MRSDFLFRAAFVLYCAEAGIFLLVAPWSPAWDRVGLMLGLELLRPLFLSTWLRALCSAFGSAHLVWCLHDLDLLVRPRASRSSDPAPAAGHQ